MSSQYFVLQAEVGVFIWQSIRPGRLCFFSANPAGERTSKLSQKQIFWYVFKLTNSACQVYCPWSKFFSSNPSDQSPPSWPQPANLVVLCSVTFQFVDTEQTVAINHARSEPFITLWRAVRWNRKIRPNTGHSQFSHHPSFMEARDERKRLDPTLAGFKVRSFWNGEKLPKKRNVRFIKYLKTFLLTSASR